jgi:ketosteroid isomerase-like protein
MDDRTVRAALQRHWDASDANDFNVEHEIYREDAVLDYPQSGERIRGRHNIQESRFRPAEQEAFYGPANYRQRRSSGSPNSY